MHDSGESFPPPRPQGSGCAKSPRVHKGTVVPQSRRGDLSSLSRRLIESGARGRGGARAGAGGGADSPAHTPTAPPADFSRLLSLFEHPVYGGQELIIRKYLSFKESRQECADIGCVWRGDEAAYSDYMPPPRLSRAHSRDWLFSSVFYVALDDEADIFPDKLQKLFMAITETKSQAIFTSYSQALRVLHCLHLELRCPQESHEQFWKNHTNPSSGNFASLISRITRLAESR
jgi:hypothetical protein